MRGGRTAAAAVAFVVAVSAFGSACSSGGRAHPPAALPGRPAGVDAVGVVTDLPESEFKEPVPKNDRERLLAKAALIYGLCSGWNVLTQLREPRPNDPDDLARYALRNYDIIHSIDPEQKVIERVRVKGSPLVTVRKVHLSDQARSDLDRLRTEAFAYAKRVAVARSDLRNHRVDAAHAQARFDDAFRRLASNENEMVWLRLTSYVNAHC